MDGGVYPLPQEAQDPPRHPQSRRGHGVAAGSPPPETSRDPGHSLCYGRPRLRTLSAAGHRHRLPTHGHPHTPGQGETRSLRDALPRPAATPPPLLEALSTPLVALSGAPHHRAHHPHECRPSVHPSGPCRPAHQGRVSASPKCSVSQLMSWFSELTPSKQAGKREVSRVFISETEH